MKDKWINIGYEGEELKPYTEPEEDFGDTKRIGEGRGEQAPQLLRATGPPEPGGGASQHLQYPFDECKASRESEVGALIPVLLLPRCVTLGRRLPLSVLPLPHR